MQQYTQEECAGHLAEAQAYLVELQEERKDATADGIREAKREIATWQYRYNVSLVNVDDSDLQYDAQDLAEAHEWDVTLLDGLDAYDDE